MGFEEINGFSSIMKDKLCDDGCGLSCLQPCCWEDCQQRPTLANVLINGYLGYQEKISVVDDLVDVG